MRAAGYGIAAGALLALFCGCSMFLETESALAGAESEVGELNRKLDAMAEKLESAPYSPAAESRGPDVTALAGIVLPENPTDDQIRRYVGEILAVSSGQNSYGTDDPQVEMLRRIGPGHLETILPFWKMDNASHSYILQAIDALAGDEDRAVVKRELSNYPYLIVPIERNGWEKEMEPELMAALEKARYLPGRLFTACGKLAGKPENRRRMIECYRSRSDAYELFRVIGTFPDADLPEITRSAWERFRKSHSARVRLGYARPAARYGSVDALGEMIFQLQGRDPSAVRYGFTDGNIAELVALTGQAGDPDRLLAWYEANRDKLVFDNAKKRFIVKLPEVRK